MSKCPMDTALNRYMEHMGPICDHHPDECPKDCEGQLAWEAEKELSALRKQVETLQAKVKAMREQAFYEANGETIAEHNERLRQEQRDLRDAYYEGRSDAARESYERGTW